MIVFTIINAFVSAKFAYFGRSPDVIDLIAGAGVAFFVLLISWGFAYYAVKWRMEGRDQSDEHNVLRYKRIDKISRRLSLIIGAIIEIVINAVNILEHS